jgi:hypothetical protein
VSLPHTNWRYVGSASFTPASPAALMNAIYDLGVATTYHDNSSRTPGLGSAGTWEKVVVSNVTESVYVTPAEDTLTSRIMIGGATYTPSPLPTVGPGEPSYVANTVVVNVVKNAGAFLQWNASSPFTSGQTFGWTRFWQTSNGTGNVYLWESKDCVAVLVSNSAGSSMYGFIGGAIIDPESDDTATDAESDGKMYGLVASGTSAIGGEFNSQGAFLEHSTFTSGPNKAGVFSPGSGSVITMQRISRFTGSVSATRLKTRSGKFARVAIVMRSNSPDNCLGRLRDIYVYTDAQVPSIQTDGAGVIGYIFGSSAANLSDCILLEH